MTNKLESYDKATRELMEAALAMDGLPRAENGMHLVGIVRLLRESFKYRTTYNRVFGAIAPANLEPSAGFCLVSSYYIYQNTGGDSQWNLMKGTNPVHWWLEHKRYGVFDITYTQFDKPFPYRSGMIERRIENDPKFLARIQAQAKILGQCAGLGD